MRKRAQKVVPGSLVLFRLHKQQQLGIFQLLVGGGYTWIFLRVCMHVYVCMYVRTYVSMKLCACMHL